MTNGVRVAIETVIFLGGDTQATKAFFSLAMGRWRKGAPPSETVSFVPSVQSFVPPSGSWVPCFGSTDRSATTRKALDLGAEHVTDFDVIGRALALYSAPDGAVFILTDLEQTGPRTTDLGEVAFIDLYTDQAAQTAKYYANTLSCRMIHEPGPTPGDYRFLASGEAPIVGVVDMLDVLPGGSTTAPPHWIPLWRVPDLEVEVARLSDLGARVRVPATDSALGPFALLADPFGVTFGLQTPLSDELLAEHAKSQTQL